MIDESSDSIDVDSQLCISHIGGHCETGGHCLSRRYGNFFRKSHERIIDESGGRGVPLPYPL